VGGEQKPGTQLRPELPAVLRGPGKDLAGWTMVSRIQKRALPGLLGLTTPHGTPSSCDMFSPGQGTLLPHGGFPAAFACRHTADLILSRSHLLPQLWFLLCPDRHLGVTALGPGADHIIGRGLCGVN
jgi:hypothetical protein